MGVARRDQGQAHPTGEVGRGLLVVALDLDSVALDLDEEVVLAEDLLVPGGRASRPHLASSWRMWSENSEETQPERQIRPSEWRSRISLSIRGL